jgi:hypothetical protein
MTSDAMDDLRCFASTLLRPEGYPSAPLRFCDPGSTLLGLGAGRQAAMETASPLAGLDQDRTGRASSAARTT